MRELEVLINTYIYRRVEPGVKFSCDIDYDPFRFMQTKDLKYGFTIALREFRSTIPTLWETTKKFMIKFPRYLNPDMMSGGLLPFISDNKGRDYNLCHFWSNFEVWPLVKSSKYYLSTLYPQSNGRLHQWNSWDPRLIRLTLIIWIVQADFFMKGSI